MTPTTRSGSSLLRAHWRPAVSGNELFLHGFAFRKGLGIGATSRKTASFLWRVLWIYVYKYISIHMYICIYIYMGVSLNGGTPKSSILTGFSIINHPFWGTTILGNPHMYTYTFRSICMCPNLKDKGKSTTKKIEISMKSPLKSHQNTMPLRVVRQPSPLTHQPCRNAVFVRLGKALQLGFLRWNSFARSTWREN